MSHFSGVHQIGDKVKFKQFDRWARRRDCPVGLVIGQVYVISGISRGIDGAYDWDDIYLKGLKQPFCEFDLEHISRG